MVEKFKILAVDDDFGIKKLIKGILEDEYNVITVSSGVEALEILPKYLPDIILLDIMMPGMDGYEVCNIIRSNPEYSDIRIIFISAKISLNSKLRGYEVGGDDYITKPFEVGELKAKITIFLGRQRSGFNRFKTRISKTIEFTEKDFEAGKHLISYFGSVLKRKYPPENAFVEIVTEGDKVTIVIKMKDELKSEIQKLLDDYGNVINGNLAPDVLFNKSTDVLELKNQLALARTQLEFQQNLIDHHKKALEDSSQLVSDLRKIIGHSMTTIETVSRGFEKVSENYTSITDAHLNHSNELLKLRSIIQKHSDAAENKTIKNELVKLLEIVENPPHEDANEKLGNTFSAIKEKSPTFFYALAGDLQNFAARTTEGIWIALMVEAIKPFI
jgi:two-component system, sensor histidine kinase and response regulator